MSAIGQGSISVDDNAEAAENAQEIANKGANGVEDINSDNKLTPSEKLSLKRLYDTDVLKHDFDVKQLTSMSLPTTDIDLALSNLTTFTAHYFANMSITETVDRQALNKVFNDFENADKAVEGLFNDAVQQVANNAKEAGDDAKQSAGQAQEASEEAKNNAQQALSNITVVDSKVTKLSGSTTAQFNTLNNGYQEVISTVNNMTISNRNLALGTATAVTMTGENRSNQVQVAYKFSSVIPLGTVVTVSFDVSSSTGVGDFTMQFYGGEPDGKPASSWQIISECSLVNGTKHVSVTLTTDSDHLHVRPRLDFATGTVTVSNFIISESSKEVNWTPAPEDLASQTDITASINNIHLGVKNADSSTATFNMNSDTILLDANKIIFSGNTSILDGTIGTAKIANAAINDAKISNLNGNKIVAGSITAEQLNANDIIANVINGKTINGITITTPNLQLGTNGILSEDWSLNQATSLFNPKKGSGTMTLTQGLLATSGTLSRWWSDDGGYWYGIGDDGSKIRNSSNRVGDNYGAGYAQHNIFDSKGNTLLRLYMDATGVYMNSGGTSNVNTVLTQQGLTTTNVAALGGINGASLTTNGTFNAALGTKNTYGFSIGSQVVSPMIRANSYTYSSNVFISSYGTMGLATSTKANKLDIVDVPNMLQKGYNLLTLNPRQWFDKTSVEAYADVQSGNSDSIESVVNIKPVTGMVAEEVASAGLDDYVVKDENNKVQGLAYDRLWTLLLPVLRDMNDKINKLQKKAGI
ncbi:hypothetical protein [Pediococcus pentosaceus]|uniref:Peptidase S74 domain-containing protein n=1 Tax=Pediococcus pentosaceus TaxID=1255 RepID=A0ABD7XA39_PEDPE|nr:hypothetical protein [Pediococcus pentosaceus]WEA58279.1 hypothetical protein PWB86_09730 [Pediococcus pentosaceus]